MRYGVTVLIISLFLIIFLSLIMMKSMHRDGNALPKYDERQRIIRGRGYMFAFYTTLIIYCLIPFVLKEETRRFLGEMLFFGPALIGVLIHVSYCVWQNAYVELNIEFKRCISIILSTSFCNLLIGMTAFGDGRMVKDDTLQFPAISLAVGALGTIIVIEMLIKRKVDKRGDVDEESEA
ncbi:hypothetical protein SAMN04487934_103214 [Eubacterium ruminantium]|nr:hypothetical protein SAMN04487934_103214 [Eubacterium ruminantium]